MLSSNQLDDETKRDKNQPNKTRSNSVHDLNNFDASVSVTGTLGVCEKTTLG